MAGMNLSFAAGVRAADTIQAKPQKPETGSSDKSSFESAIKNEADKAGQQAGTTAAMSVKNRAERAKTGGKTRLTQMAKTRRRQLYCLKILLYQWIPKTCLTA